MKIAVSQGKKQVEKGRGPSNERLRLVPEIEYGCRKSNSEIAEERENHPSSGFGIFRVSAKPCYESVAEDRRTPHPCVRIAGDIEMLTVNHADCPRCKYEPETEKSRNGSIDGKEVFECHVTPPESVGNGNLWLL